jgi:hypothetical protein
LRFTLHRGAGWGEGEFNLEEGGQVNPVRHAVRALQFVALALIAIVWHDALQ